VLAFAWSWSGFEDALPSEAAARLANSLCSGIGGYAGSYRAGALNFAFRALGGSSATARAWRPARLDGGRFAIFHGYFDNAVAIAGELGLASSSDLAEVYAQAVDRWGDEADLRIIGEYCAVLADPGQSSLRLSRSPLRAPPLCYGFDERLVVAASDPRALFAMGLPKELNEQRVVDSAMLHFTDDESGWFKTVSRVPVGAIVELRPGKQRSLRRYYDMARLPEVRLGSDAEYLARASELFDEAIGKCLAGVRRPGTTLSGGLDSSQVTARVLAALPDEVSLPTFTFHPLAEWDGQCETGMLGNERPAVEAFARMHARLIPHFTDNAGYANDHRWTEFFHLMGGAPSGLCNMYVFHGIWAAARDVGCDRLLLAEWGNYTFSDKGGWGFVEYFLTGRWRQLWRALMRNPHDRRSLPRRFLAMTLMPLMPLTLWRRIKRFMHPEETAELDLICPLRPSYRRSSGGEARLRQSGFRLDRYQPWNRRHAQRMLWANSDCESAETYQAFEVLYGVAQRDPTAYRPFVEFCYGLPVEMFMRDGEHRWLAKQLACGIMPEEQRANHLNGRWDSDWLVRLRQKRDEYLEEFDRIEQDPQLAEMIDVPRLRAALAELPAETPTNRQQLLVLEMALPRAMQVARFVRYARQSNFG
jgi:asparagine synthase (glutamine-hydrolysing)